MTNEQLATFISADKDENKSLIPVLWEQVNKLLYAMANEFYRRHSDSCIRHGVELSDLRQGCYSVFIGALDAYKPDSDTKFTSYFKYQFQIMTAELLNIKTKQGQQEPLNNCTSLDKEIDMHDGSTATIADVIPDEESTDFVDNIIETISRETESKIIHAAINQLPERQQKIINAHYFQGLTLKQISENLNISVERVRQLESYALRELRQSKQLRMLYTEYQNHAKWISVSRFQYSPEYYALCNSLREKPISYGERQAIIYDAQRKWESEKRISVL